MPPTFHVVTCQISACHLQIITTTILNPLWKILKINSHNEVLISVIRIFSLSLCRYVVAKMCSKKCSE